MDKDNRGVSDICCIDTLMSGGCECGVVVLAGMGCRVGSHCNQRDSLRSERFFEGNESECIAEALVIINSI